MTAWSRKMTWILLIGDLAVFVLSLWFSLFFRYADFPVKASFIEHLRPFSLLFIVWLIVFFISGLYDKQNFFTRTRLSGLLIRAQIINILIATVFFYFIPWYGITPKTTLFLYLIVSLGLVLVWRAYGSLAFSLKTSENAIVIGSGRDVDDLVRHVNGLGELGFTVVSSVDLNSPRPAFRDHMFETIAKHNVSVVIADLLHEKITDILPHLYNLMFRGIRFIDMNLLYEDVFDRVPLSLIKYNWFLENVSTTPQFIYDLLKRLMDIIVALILGVISLLVYPFVALAIKLEDKGPVFISQERVGRNGRIIRILKFRSMSVSAQDSTGASKPQYVTKTGSFIRKTRIDELPQLWNVIKGDLSLIGPRPELPQFVELYEKDIPFYSVRHLIKPGLSGWAQLYHRTPPKFAASKEDTAMKLSYDLYYIKNRSFLLDLNIALKTVKELVSRKGV